MESARLATSDDVADIEALGGRHRTDIAEQRGASLYLRREAGTVPAAARIESGIADDSVIVVVGCYDDVVFGYGYATIELLSDGSKLARLTDFLVQAEARKSGIGEAMMNLVVEIATEAGCIGIDSVALPGDRDTKNFFESFGLKARLLTVHRGFD